MYLSATKSCVGTLSWEMTTQTSPQAAQMMKWNKEKIVDALRSLRDGRLGLNYNAVEEADSRLAAAITHHFGSHDSALRAAGIDPKSVRRPRRSRCQGDLVVRSAPWGSDSVPLRLARRRPPRGRD